MNILKSTCIIALCLSSSALIAESKYEKYGSTQGNTFFDYARVLDASPVYRIIRVSTPRKRCWDEPVVQSDDYYDYPKSTGGMVVGGILGGVIGHQLGKGRGKKLATAVGTLIGAQIGHEVNNGSLSSNQSGQTAYREYCEVHHQTSYEEVLETYQITYQYKGHTYHTEMPYHPGKRIKMRIQISPVI